MPRRTSRVLSHTVAVLCLALPAGLAQAQREGEGGRRIYNEQLRVQLDQQQASAREMGLDAGGWFTFAFMHYDDAPGERQRTLRQYDLRLWALYTHQGVHTFYVRGRTSYDDWNHGDNPDEPGGSGDEFNDPKLERGWYRYDYNRQVRNQTGVNPPVGFVVEVGRNYYEIGQGFTLALPLDAVQTTVTAGNFQWLGLIGKTVTHTSNIDASEAVQDHMDRNFYGTQASYRFSHHEPYVYYLWQEDRTRPWGGDQTQEYSYDSRYLGGGSKGSLLLQNLRYGAELVFETGKSAPEGSAHELERIHAMGLDMLLEYLFDVAKHPKLMVEYMFGSGDPDRRLSSSSTIGGNLIGTKDTAFNAFGYRDTGLAFAPRISNIDIWVLGASFLPLEHMELFRRMEVGTKVFFYNKDIARGPISDTPASKHSRWLGWEWDVYVNWRITSDLAWTIRYGAFQEGAAYEGEGTREFVYTGLTYSF